MLHRIALEDSEEILVLYKMKFILKQNPAYYVDIARIVQDHPVQSIGENHFGHGFHLTRQHDTRLPTR